jgi:hypothetical protein
MDSTVGEFRTAGGVTLGVEHFGDETAPLVLLAGAVIMLSWRDALCEALARGGRHVGVDTRRVPGAVFSGRCSVGSTGSGAPIMTPPLPSESGISAEIKRSGTRLGRHVLWLALFMSSIVVSSTCRATAPEVRDREA